MIDRVTNPVHANASPPGRAVTSRSGEVGKSAEHPAHADAVELSEVAREQMAPPESPPIREALVERVRAEIAAGTYLTDEKLNAAVSRMQELLFAAA